MHQYVQTSGILLRKVLLPNDDAILDFFTRDLGRVSVIVKRFAKSKKKAAEIDYFRVLDLQLRKGKSFFSLESVSTVCVFPMFLSDYTLNFNGFSWLSLLHKITTEEQPDRGMFDFCIDFFHRQDEQFLEMGDSYFRLKMLLFSGLFFRFDVIRGDVYFDPVSCDFFENNAGNLIFIPNETRQCIEFLRRSSGEEYFLKRMNLPTKSILLIQKILFLLEQNYY